MTHTKPSRQERLCSAIRGGDEQRVRALLGRSGVDVNGAVLPEEERAPSPLWLAYNERQLSIFELLASQPGAELAAHAGCQECTSVDASRKQCRGTIMHRAAGDGDGQFLGALLGAGADPRARDCRGLTPLMVARSSRCAKRLLQAAGPAALDDRSVLGSTPLHMAAFHSQSRVEKVLLTAGADKEARSNAGATPAMTARDPILRDLLLASSSEDGSNDGSDDDSSSNGSSDSGSSDCEDAVQRYRWRLQKRRRAFELRRQEERLAASTGALAFSAARIEDQPAMRLAAAVLNAQGFMHITSGSAAVEHICQAFFRKHLRPLGPLPDELQALLQLQDPLFGNGDFEAVLRHVKRKARRQQQQQRKERQRKEQQRKEQRKEHGKEKQQRPQLQPPQPQRPHRQQQQQQQKQKQARSLQQQVRPRQPQLQPQQQQQQQQQQQRPQVPEWMAALAAAAAAAAPTPEGRYRQLQDLPFDAAALQQLQAHYMTPYAVYVEGASATRSGAVRETQRLRPCRPRAQQYHVAVRDRLQQLAQLADGKGGAGDDQRGGSGGGGCLDAGAAARELLWWLRCMGLYDAYLSGREARPRLLGGGTGPGTAAGGAGSSCSGGSDVVMVESIDLVEYEGVDEWLLANGWAIVSSREGAQRHEAPGVKRERLDE